MDFTKEFESNIIAELDKKVKNIVCPICGKDVFSVVEGFTTRDVSKNYAVRQIGGRLVPSFTIICAHCGYIMDFSIGVLGFLAEEATALNKDENEEKKIKN